jgi:O-antigen/teichoic acid export membrane protein
VTPKRPVNVLANRSIKQRRADRAMSTESQSRLADRIAYWTTRGFWAVVDQALFAVSNLIVNLLLARWLPSREYGAFVAAYVVLILISVAHSALLIEPMLVFGPSTYAGHFKEYLRAILRFHWVFGAAAAATLVLVAAILYAAGADLLGRTFLGLACAAPFILLSWLARRACYAERKPAVAALGGAVYLITAGVGSIFLYNLGLLTPIAAQLLMGTAACASSGLILRVIMGDPSGRISAAETWSLWARHWKFGRWSAASGLLYWTQGQVFYLVLPLWNGLEATAALRALTNFVMPVLQSDGALVTLLAPELARIRLHTNDLSRYLRWATRLFAIEGLVYWAVIVVFRRDLVMYVYGGKYVGSADLLIVLGALPLLGSRLNILGAVLRAFERTDQLFRATVASAVASLAVGFATMATLGIYGAVFATVISQAAQIVAIGYFLRKPPDIGIDAVATSHGRLSRILEVQQ